MTGGETLAMRQYREARRRFTDAQRALMDAIGQLDAFELHAIALDDVPPPLSVRERAEQAAQGIARDLLNNRNTELQRRARIMGADE